MLNFDRIGRIDLRRIRLQRNGQSVCFLRRKCLSERRNGCVDHRRRNLRCIVRFNGLLTGFGKHRWAEIRHILRGRGLGCKRYCVWDRLFFARMR